jgi:hypothetical protein
MHAWRAAPAALAALTACQLPLDRATCPCAEGWFCCESSQLCVADRTLADEPECAGLPPTTYTNPVADAPVSNPAILRDGTTYYAYSDGFDLDRIHIMSSPDLVRWTAIGGALVAPVAWADSSGSSFTSPSVVRFDSNPPDRQLVLYFTAQHTGTGERCIGVATAEDPRGPFTAAAEPLICPAGGAQDPSFISGTEKLPFPQLVYRQNGSVIRLYNEVLTPDGLSVLSSDGRRLIFEASPGWWHHGIVERPAFVKDNDDLYLFFAGAAAGGVDRAIGWSPCHEGYGILSACLRQTYLGTWMVGDAKVASLGGPQVFYDGSWWIAYHARDASSCSSTTCSGPPTLRIDKLCFKHGLPRTTGPSTGPVPLARHADCSADVPSKPLNVEAFQDELVVPQPATVTSREGGHTAPLDGRLLWAFSDTGLNTCPSCGLFNGTAALGVPAPATTNAAWAEEPLDADGFPSPFIPYTASDAAPGGGTFKIRVGGLLTLSPLSSDALVVFVRSTPGASSVAHSIGLARVHAGATRVDRNPAVSPLACNPTCLFDSDVVADLARGGVYDRPFLHDDMLYLVGAGKLARAPLDSINARVAWRFWNGASWLEGYKQAVVTPNLRGTFSYDAYLDLYVALGEGAPPNAHHLVIATASALTGPWTAPKTLRVADQGCPGMETGAHGWIHHPSLAMNGGRTFAVSYIRPGEYGTPCPNQVRLSYINLAP